MNSPKIKQQLALLSCLAMLCSCDRTKIQSPKPVETQTTKVSRPLPIHVPESVPPIEGLAKEWVESKSLPQFKCSIGWLIFNREFPIKTWNSKNEPSSHQFDEFLFDETFSASDTVCLPIFAREGKWGLVFLKKQQQWLWVKETPENAEQNMDVHNEYGRFESWPLTKPGEEEFESDWVLCYGTITSLTKESSTIRNAPNDNADIVCKIPDHSSSRPAQPKFTRSKGNERPTAETSFEDEKYKQINKASYSKSIIVKVLESKGDWVRVRPSDWNCGTWGVDTYDDVIGRVLFKWHPSISGWVKWRVPGPVKGSYRVVIDISELVGC